MIGGLSTQQASVGGGMGTGREKEQKVRVWGQVGEWEGFEGLF